MVGENVADVEGAPDPDGTEVDEDADEEEEVSCVEDDVETERDPSGLEMGETATDVVAEAEKKMKGQSTSHSTKNR